MFWDKERLHRSIYQLLRKPTRTQTAERASDGNFGGGATTETNGDRKH